MIKKNIIIIFCIAVVILIAVAFIFSMREGRAKDLSRITDKEVISLLVKNKDSNDYMQNHKDFSVLDKLVLTKDSILAGRNAQNFKEVYYGLDLENNRYMRVDLTNTAGDRGLITVLDFKTNKVIKAYGTVLLQMGSK